MPGRRQTSTSACIRRQNRFSMAIAHRVTADAEPVLTQGDRVPPAHRPPLTKQLRRVPRLLAAALLRQRGRDRRVLGLPREGRGDGPLPAAQVRGARARRRDADAADDHPQRPQARGRPGRLHRAVQRDRRDDRRRHRVPARRDNNFRFVGGDEYDGIWLRELAEREASKVWVKPSHRPAPQRRRPGPAQPGRCCEIVWTPPTQPAFDELKLVPVRWSGGSGATTGSRSSSRGPATPASSAMRSGATRRTARRVWDAI